MCGFAGFFKLTRNHGVEDVEILQDMSAALAHRGPDAEGIYQAHDLAMVFRRLKIVGGENGDQPIWNEDKTVCVAVNGEIYNHVELRERLAIRHRFQTESDSEVVLHLFEDHGPAAFRQLVGEFAIVIWNAKDRKITLCRDRLGVKPLYFYATESLLLFGSELKALLCHPLCPRRASWLPDDSSVSGGHISHSYVQGVEVLPGGWMVEFDPSDGLTKTQWWAINSHLAPVQSASKDFAEAVEEYRELLRETVRLYLQGEGPKGLFLSGGLDSSLLAAVAAELGTELQCYMIVQKGSHASGDFAAAKTLTSQLNLPFAPLDLSQSTILDDMSFGLETIEALVWTLDRPGFTMECLLKKELHRFAKRRQPDLKIMLLGQGADEFAGGYSNEHYVARSSQNWGAYVDSQILSRERMAEAIRRNLPASLYPLFSDRFKAELLPSNCSPYQLEMLRAVESLQTYNLWHEDRTSASQGIEARVPFLHYRLVEFLAAVPPRQHAEWFWDKQFLRHVAKRWLPPHLTTRPKIGFTRGPDGISNEDVHKEILRRITRAFVEKYLDTDAALFSRDAFLRQFRDCMESYSYRKFYVLMDAVTYEIFQSLCYAEPRLGSEEVETHCFG